MFVCSTNKKYSQNAVLIHYRKHPLYRKKKERNIEIRIILSDSS